MKVRPITPEEQQALEEVVTFARRFRRLLGSMPVPQVRASLPAVLPGQPEGPGLYLLLADDLFSGQDLPPRTPDLNDERQVIASCPYAHLSLSESLFTRPSPWSGSVARLKTAGPGVSRMEVGAAGLRLWAAPPPGTPPLTAGDLWTRLEAPMVAYEAWGSWDRPLPPAREAKSRPFSQARDALLGEVRHLQRQGFTLNLQGGGVLPHLPDTDLHPEQHTPSPQTPTRKEKPMPIRHDPPRRSVRMPPLSPEETVALAQVTYLHHSLTSLATRFPEPQARASLAVIVPPVHRGTEPFLLLASDGPDPRTPDLWAEEQVLLGAVNGSVGLFQTPYLNPEPWRRARTTMRQDGPRISRDEIVAAGVILWITPPPGQDPLTAGEILDRFGPAVAAHERADRQHRGDKEPADRPRSQAIQAVLDEVRRLQRHGHVLRGGEQPLAPLPERHLSAADEGRMLSAVLKTADAMKLKYPALALEIDAGTAVTLSPYLPGRADDLGHTWSQGVGLLSVTLGGQPHLIRLLDDEPFVLGDVHQPALSDSGRVFSPVRQVTGLEHRPPELLPPQAQPQVWTRPLGLNLNVSELRHLSAHQHWSTRPQRQVAVGTLGAAILGLFGSLMLTGTPWVPLIASLFFLVLGAVTFVLDHRQNRGDQERLTRTLRTQPRRADRNEAEPPVLVQASPFGRLALTDQGAPASTGNQFGRRPLPATSGPAAPVAAPPFRVLNAPRGLTSEKTPVRLQEAARRAEALMAQTDDLPDDEQTGKLTAHLRSVLSAVQQAWADLAGPQTDRDDPLNAGNDQAFADHLAERLIRAGLPLQEARARRLQEQRDHRLIDLDRLIEDHPQRSRF